MAAEVAPIRPILTCVMREVTRPDLETVEALCRLRVSARRLGYVLRLVEGASELDALLAFCGLASTFTESQGEAEEGEEALGVEEEVEPGDPAV